MRTLIIEYSAISFALLLIYDRVLSSLKLQNRSMKTFLAHISTTISIITQKSKKIKFLLEVSKCKQFKEMTQALGIVTRTNL